MLIRGDIEIDVLKKHPNQFRVADMLNIYGRLERVGMNKKEIEQALRDYRWMINEIKRQRELLNDVNPSVTAQGGIESSLPKAKGVTGDPVAREVIRRDKASRWVQNLEKKVLFIQERIPIIKDEREKAVLQCMLDGMSMRAISQHMGLSERHVFRLKDSIVSQMAEMADMSDLAGSFTSEKTCV